MIQPKVRSKLLSFFLLSLLVATLLSVWLWRGASLREPAQVVAAVVAGFDHNCSIVSGAVKCWGSNAWGQVETGGDALPRGVPTTVIASGATAVAAGEFHSCAVASGALQCWGDNNRGQLGDGNIEARVLPVQVISAGVTAVAAGSQHTCAIVKGSLQCWGDNNSGQIGDGSTVGRTLPVTVIDSGVTAVAAGRDSTCAIVAGALKCWGLYNDKIISAPQTIIADGVTAVATGVQHTCAVVRSSLQCWGYSIGNGDKSTHTKPVTVIASGVTAVSTTFGHSCAIVSQALQCWGYNYYGQLGSAFGTEILVPVTIIASGVTAVAVGNNHTCAIIAGILNCWGRNSNAQVGDGTTLGDGNSEGKFSPTMIISANGDNLWLNSIVPEAPVGPPEAFPQSSLSCSEKLSDKITLPEMIDKEQLIDLLHPAPFATTDSNVEILCGVGAKEWKLGKSYIAVLLTQRFTKNTDGGMDSKNYHLVLATIENSDLTQGLKIIASLEQDLDSWNMAGLDFIDTAAYKINSTEYAFGLRSALVVSYSGGGGSNNYLQLFRVQGDQLVPILKTVMASNSLIAGEWNQDGSRDHEEYSSGPAIIRVLTSEHSGVYDLEKTIKEKKQPHSMIFTWNGESYSSNDPEIVEKHNED